MSEFMIESNASATKRRLLIGTSLLTLVAALPQAASAGDSRPTVWIEVGSQLERLTDGEESFAPPFVTTLLENPFTSPAEVQRPPRYSFGQDARLSFVPEGTDWVVSVAVRYARANHGGNSHEEIPQASAHSLISIPVNEKYITSLVSPSAKRFATTAALTHSTSLMLDFQAGKDVGLGVFGSHGTSTLSAGVRFAQFTSRSKVRIDSDPNATFNYKYLTTFAGNPANIKIPRQDWDLYAGKMNVTRSFHGVGPSLSWDDSAMMFGGADTSSVSLDWGLNAALLFGRQKMQAHHTTTAHHGSQRHGSGPLPTLYPTNVHSTARSRSIIVPNIGGFAGFSLRFPNAKVSAGYRVDAFFGAMDGGIDTRKTYDRDFYGPFATISIGL
jgi:hypothetical protein